MNRLGASLLRAPTRLYDVGAGRLLGRRFLLLTHRGRRSGRTYRTLLEVVRWRPGAGEAVVMSGRGRRAGWYLNVLDGGAEELRIGPQRFHPSVRELNTDEAAGVFAEYERRNRLIAPLIRAIASRLAGFRYDGSDGARRRLVEALPLIALAAPDSRD